MVRILFLVGKNADFYPGKYTSKKSPKCLRNISGFEDFIDDDEKLVPSDVAMALYLRSKHPKDDIECMFGDDVQSKKVLDPYDVVFVVFDPIEVFHGGCDKATCPSEAKRMERALKATKAFVYPYPEFHKYIIVKPSYYFDLRRAGLPVAPFFKITPKTALKDIKKFKDKILKKGWEGAIIKPSYAGYSLGIEVHRNISRTRVTTLRKNFKSLEKHGFPSVTVQKFIPSFGDHYEIRTYWINGKYACALGTLTEAVGDGGDGLPITDEDTFVSEGGTIPNRIKRELKKLGLQVQEALRQYPYKHPLLRIDFGCCLNFEKDCEDTYFINEVETMAANMLAEDMDYPIVEKSANALYSFAKKVSGTKEPKGKKSCFRVKNSPCVPHEAPKKSRKKRRSR